MSDISYEDAAEYLRSLTTISDLSRVQACVSVVVDRAEENETLLSKYVPAWAAEKELRLRDLDQCEAMRGCYHNVPAEITTGSAPVQPVVSNEGALRELKEAIDFYEEQEKTQWEYDHRSTYKTSQLAEGAYQAIAALRAALAGLDEQINLRMKAEQEAISLRAALADRSPHSSIFREIDAERERQDAKWGEQNHPVVDLATVLGLKFFRDQARDTCELHAKLGTCTWYDILKEEFYEAFAESEPARQREELVQVGAVAVEIIEYIDRVTTSEKE